jgi:hypothetical protein
MSTFVEECRREWKRLGVPDLMADEMATDLETDLAEAQADGVSAAEILGESDPRRFASTWAEERGLVSEPPPPKSRKRLWIAVAAVVALFLVFGGMAAFGLLATTSVGGSQPTAAPVESIRPIQAVRVPVLVGLKACRAERIARRQGLKVRRVPRSRCKAVVVEQHPRPRAVVPRHAPLTLLTRP